MCFDNALLAITNIANYIEESNNFLEAFGVCDVGGEGGGNMILLLSCFSFSSPVLNIFVVLNEKNDRLKR